MAKTDTRPNSRSSKGLLARLFGLGRQPRIAEPLVIPRAEHSISRKQMAEEVLKVLYRLHNSGYKAYLVGGAVRDLLLGRTPKDYDVSTDARPDEIKKLFANCRLIGRRFRLAHILFKGGQVIEVSTFRRNPGSPEEGEEGDRDLLISEDNTWGNAQEDAYRRDFTVNALFYNIADFSVIDYVGGLNDLHEQIIRTIGDPDVRFREDPVRMLRAVEYAARLDFSLHPDIRKAIQKHRRDLKRASDVRIADEILHLLRSGSAETALRMMRELGLLDILHPALHTALEGERAEAFYAQMKKVDTLQNKGESLRDVALLSQLFLPPLERSVKDAESKKNGRLSKGEFLVQAERTLDPEATLFPVPNRRRHQIQQAMLAVRKMHRHPSRHRGLDSMAERAYFLDAFDLLRIDVASGGAPKGLLEEWSELRDKAAREGKLVDPDSREEKRSRGRGRSRRGERDRDRRSRGGRQRQDRDRTERTEEKKSSGRSRRSTADSARQTRERRPREDRAPQDRTPKDRTREEQPREEKAPQPRERRPRDRKPREDRARKEAVREQPAPEQERPPDQVPTREEASRETAERTTQRRERQPRERKPREERPRESEPSEERQQEPREEIATPAQPPVELLIPPPDADMQHGRLKREHRSWSGMAGQTSGTIKKMKEGIASGEFHVPPSEQIPYVVPGKSVNETLYEWDAMVGRADEIAADETRPDSDKWGRTRRRIDPSLK